MATIPASYKEVFSLKNDDKILMAMFLNGPSKAVMNSGKVFIKDTNNPAPDNDAQNKENNAEQNTDKPADSSNNADKSNNTDSEKASSESYNYSLFEAFSRLNKTRFYEDDINIDDAVDNLHANKAADKAQSNDTAQSDDKSNAESDKSEPKDNDDKSDNKSDEDESEHSDDNVSDTEFIVIVDLPNEGCTKWRVRLDNVSDVTKVKNAIISKKFRTARDLANKLANANNKDGQPIEALKVLSVSTMIDKNNEAYAPFVGRCRWAFDVGSDSPEDSAELEIAIAPFNCKKQPPKPDEKIIYHSVYKIIGDITDGSLEGFEMIGKVKDFFNGDDNKENNDPSKSLSDWLHKKFKCVGDSSMYKQFLAIRKFVKECIKNKTLKEMPEANGASNVKNYAATVKSAKAFILF